jgi:AraC-like DNA-binding protein
MYHFIEIKSDNSESIKYDSQYPIYIRKSPLSIFYEYAAQSHWHDDVEFIYILSGKMEYNINGEIVTLNETDGLFVNAHQFHYGFSSERKECIFLCIIIHPSLLCSQPDAENDFILPIVKNGNFPFSVLKSNIGWQKQICDYLQEIYNCKGECNWELKVQGMFSLIWALLLENKPPFENYNYGLSNNLMIFKKMVRFIQEHSSENITLPQIAEIGGVGQSKCCKLFNNYISQTPIEYLIECRINNSLKLLRNTDMSVTEIAFSTGFGGSSYFGKIFKRRIGTSPAKYRNNYSETNFKKENK